MKQLYALLAIECNSLSKLECSGRCDLLARMLKDKMQLNIKIIQGEINDREKISRSEKNACRITATIARYVKKIRSSTKSIYAGNYRKISRIPLRSGLREQDGVRCN